MADPGPAVVNNTIKGVLSILALLFNAWIIVWTTMYGESGNTLHSSAQSWAFIMGSGILFALGVGSITPDLLSAWTKKA